MHCIHLPPVLSLSMVLAVPPSPSVGITIPIKHVTHSISLAIDVLTRVVVTVGPGKVPLAIHQIHQDLAGVDSATLPNHETLSGDHPKPPLPGVVGPPKLVIGQINDGAHPMGLSIQHLPLIHPHVLCIRKKTMLNLKRDKYDLYKWIKSKCMYNLGQTCIQNCYQDQG